MAGRKRHSETGDEATSSKLIRTSDPMWCGPPIVDTAEDDDVFSLQQSTSASHYATGDVPHEFQPTSSSSNPSQNVPGNGKVIALLCDKDPPSSRLIEILSDVKIGINYLYQNLPELRTHACLVVVKNFAYVIGGTINERPTRSALQIDLESNNSKQTWSEAPFLKVARSHHACAVLNGIIYSSGGRTDESSAGSISRTSEMLAPGMDRVWTVITVEMAMCRCQHSMVAFKGELFVFGGTGHTPEIQLESSVAQIEKYSPEQNEWKVLKILDEEIQLSPGRINGAAICFNNNIWLLGGSATRESKTGASSLEFDGKSFTTKKIPIFKQSRKNISAVVYNNNIYICGRIGKKNSTGIEEFSKNRWKGLLLRFGKDSRIYSNGLAVFKPSNSRVPTTPSVN